MLPLSIIIGLLALNVTFSQAATKHAAYVIDANTGKVLYSKYGTARRYPASLTKMMTLYMVFEALEQRKLRLNSRIKFSKYSASRPPSKLGIRPGRSISVKDAIYALVTKSANDVAAAVGEKIGGSESGFARLMTKKARQLGMRNTVFRNASGLPNRHQYTTAKDMATLGLALREHFPRYYHVFKTRMFKFGKRRYGNHNKLLGRVKGVDGIKTGYTRASGFNLVTSVGVGNRRIVAVVMGGKSGGSRNATMTRLIRKYLRKASNRKSKKRLLVARHKPLLKSGKTTQVALKSIPSKNLPTPTARPALVSAIAKPTRPSNDIAVAALQAPKPKAKPTAKPSSLTQTIAMLEAKPLPVEKIRPVEIEVVKPKTGWLIQIAAVPSLKAARSVHQKVAKNAPALIASAEPFTQQVTKGSAEFYRVRYAGFKSKAEARRTCQQLKKKSISCLALHQ